ncbi:Uncharacterized protein Fot_18952 [Forsythia ovata]|uniref:Uncharacterized protein n=1 Tax=Forsythia ovata TaxID=205694 RepID=A0ABD1VK29_9LAMI
MGTRPLAIGLDLYYAIWLSCEWEYLIQPDQWCFVGIEQQDIRVVKVDGINSQIQETTKHTNQTTRCAKSQPEKHVQAETTKAEAIKGLFDVVMSTYEKLVADHLILKIQFQHLIDVFGSSIEDVLKVLKDRMNANHMEIQQHNQLEITSTDAHKKVQEMNTNMRSRRPNLLREIMRPHGCKIYAIKQPDLTLSGTSK